jgi:signal transduction histidine kinase
LSTTERELRFQVKDTGPGISKDNISKVFDRFWQAKESAYKGSGLGLSIAQGIAKAHGGRIWVESEVGKGSTFFLALPTISNESTKKTSKRVA